MAIRTYDQPQVRANALPDAVQNVNHTPEAYGAGVARATQGFGGALGAAARTLQKMEEEDGKLWAAEQASEMRIAAHERDRELRENGPVDGKGHGFRVMEGLHTDVESRKAQAPNRFAEKFLEEHALRISESVAMQATNYEYEARRRYRLTSFDNAVMNQRNHLVDNPDQWAGAHMAIEELASNLPDAERARLQSKAMSDLAVAAIQGKIRKEPGNAQTAMQRLQHGDVVAIIRKQAKAKEADPLYLMTLAGIEGGFDPLAKNPNSTATGLYQYIDQTAKEEGNFDRTDPGASTVAAIRTTKKNEAAFRNSMGKDPERWELYLMHQQGRAGGLKLLQNPEARAVDVVGEKAVLLNGGNAGMSAGEFAGLWKKNYTEAETRFGHLATDNTPDLLISQAWDDLSAEQKLGALKQAESAAREKRSEEKARLAQLMADAEAAFMTGEMPEVEPNGAQLLKLHGPEKGAILWQQYRDTRALGLMIRDYRSMPESKMRATWHARKPQPGEGYAHKYGLWEREGAVVERILAERRADPVGAALRTLPALQEAVQQNKAEDMGGYYAALWAAQGEMGIGEDARALLTAGQAKDLIDRWQDPSQPLNTRLAPLLSVVQSTRDPTQQRALLLQLDRVGLPKGVIHISGPLQNDPRGVQTMLAGADARKMQPQFDVRMSEKWKSGYADALPAGALRAFSPAFQEGLEAAIHNYYVGLSFEAGDNSGYLDEERLKTARDAITGGVIEIDRQGVWAGSFRTFAAWPGQTASEFEQLVSMITDEDIDGAYLPDGDGRGGGRLSSRTLQRDATFIPVGNGGYHLQVGASTVIGRDFLPIILDLGSMRDRLEEKKRDQQPVSIGKHRKTYEEALEEKRYVEKSSADNQ